MWVYEVLDQFKTGKRKIRMFDGQREYTGMAGNMLDSMPDEDYYGLVTEFSACQDGEVKLTYKRREQPMRG